MSELGLFDETPTTKGRHRHRRSGSGAPPKPKKKRGGKSLLALVLVLAVLGGVGYAGWWGVGWLQDFATAADYEGDGTGSVVIEIRSGQRLDEIGQVLFEADVVASQRAFVEAADANPEAQNIQPGFYELPQQMRAALAVELLLDLENRVVDRVTIPEGLTSFRTISLLSEQLGIPEEEFEEAAADPIELGVPDFWFNRTDGKDVEPLIEGFLFPSTYEFPPDPTAEQVLSQMVNQFLTVAGSIDFADRVESERNIAPYEALIVASLAQAEAGVPEDLGRVARVAYNRVYQDQPELGCNRCLQFDVTVNYWLELTGQPTKSSAEMTPEELTDPSNPYNRNVEGLVPSPINNPGQAALEAAMDPPEGDWVYFVAVDEEGNSEFAETFEEHCQNIQTAVEAGILSESFC